MTPQIRSLRFALIALLLAGLAPASYASDYHSPRTAALGGAGHAGPLLNDAIYLNPSFSAFLPSYSFSGNYSFFKGRSVPNEPSDPHGNSVNFSIQDGRSELFQAGVAYSGFIDRKVISLGAGKAAVKRLGFGLGGKFILPDLGPEREDLSPFWDSILSVTWIPFDWLQLAFIVDHLTESRAARELQLFREFILGSKWNVMGIFLIYFDPHWTPTPEAPFDFGHELGLEFPFFKDLYLRMGHFRNAYAPAMNQWGDGFGVGLGWIGPRISFDYAYKRAYSPRPANEHVFGTTVFF